MTAHFVIAHTDAEQPFHVRVVAENGEPILSSENLADKRDAERVVCVLAEMFGWHDARLTHGTAEPWEWSVIDGANTRFASVVHLDQRVGSEPTC